jgi:2-iminobutanoate/2-iminopropanoate deaminase
VILLKESEYVSKMPTRQVIRSENAPKPGGPYSHAIVAEGQFVFVAGQVGTDPKTGKLPEGIAAQTEQALRNLKSILESAGTTLENVVRVGVYLRDIDNFSAMNKVYETFFPKNPPARSTIEAKLAGEFLVEIDCIALKQ